MMRSKGTCCSTRSPARARAVCSLEAEVTAYLEAHAAERDGDDHALVVRNRKGRTRRVTIGSGTIAVSAPRVNDRRGDPRGPRWQITRRPPPPHLPAGPQRAGGLSPRLPR